MEITRFKQLLESTMGNVKPIITEEDTTIGVESMLDSENLDQVKEQEFCSPSAPPKIVTNLLNKIPENIKEQAKTTIKNLAKKMENLSLQDLLNLRKEVKQKKSNLEQSTSLQEQVTPILILGVAISPSLLIAIGAILIIIILVLIFSKKGKRRGKSCNPGWWDNL